MLRRLLELISALAFFIWGYFFSSPDLKPELYGMTIGTSVVLIVDLLLYLYEIRHFLSLYWKCYWTKGDLRLTIAYLYRIEFNGKYLLVKSNRIDNTYQPVGGVYKYFHPEASKELEAMDVIPDTKIDNDDKSEYDLRLKLTTRRNLKKFLSWFFSKKEREQDPWREFYEELISSQILPQESFGFIYHELIGQHFEPIHYDLYFEVDTFKYVDIYKPRFVNQDQKDKIKQLMPQSSTDYIWVTQEEIKRKKSNNGELIADHTYKIFHNKKLR